MTDAVNVVPTNVYWREIPVLVFKHVRLHYHLVLTYTILLSYEKILPVFSLWRVYHNVGREVSRSL